MASNRPVNVSAISANIRDAAVSTPVVTTTNIPVIKTDIVSNKPVNPVTSTVTIRDAAVKPPVVTNIPAIKTDMISSKPVNPVTSTVTIREAAKPLPTAIPVILKEVGKPTIMPVINRTTLNVAKTRKP